MDLLQSLLHSIDYKVESALWLGISMGLYIVGARVAWHYRQPGPSRLGHWVRTIKGWPYRHWPLEAVRFLYYIGIPYAGLLRGVILPRLMGLTDPDWVKGIGLGAALGGGAFLLLALICWWYARATASLPPPTRRRLGANLGDESINGWGLLREAIYLQAHWAFYRSVVILLLNDHYTGTFLGFLLITLEWAMNPAWREDLNSPWRSAHPLLRWSTAFSTAIIFLFIRNLWLLMPIHWGIEVACQRLLTGFSQLENKGSAGDALSLSKGFSDQMT
jgi:hypothetical protein